MKRFDATVVAGFIVSWVAWTVFGLLVAPKLVSDAYDQQSWPVLNRLIGERPINPKQSYLHQWTVWFQTSQVAAVGLAVVAMVLFGPKAVRTFPRQDPDSSRSYAAKRVVLLVVTGLVLIWAIWLLPRHDYVAHMAMWEVVRSGGNPWAREAWNAYGPLFNALAALYSISPVGPKLLYCTVACLMAVWFLGRLGGGWWRFMFGLCVFFGTPSFWIMIPYFGMFDVLCAAGVVTALWLRRGARDGGAGIALGVATLFKFYPVFATPALALDGGRFRWRVLAGWAGTVAAGYGAGLAILGEIRV
jgi:hypothetical protein